MAFRVSSLRQATGISASEFSDAFNKILFQNEGKKLLAEKSHRFGIAVSGGSDSMALAHLCQQLKQHRSGVAVGRFLFVALIVDHQLRKSSSIEAINTKLRLSRMGLDARVIRPEWPAGFSSHPSQYIETFARRLRYQALGKACVELGISTLLLAHHEDDQAETVLMNLAASREGTTIRSIAYSTTIPECYGMHGAYRSGSYERAAISLSSIHVQNFQPPDNLEEVRFKPLAKKPPVFESGGVEICRPLLAFSKDQLRRTCIEKSIEWEEDESNHEVSVTSRNTIRNLLSNGRLPRALQKTSLLQIASQRLAQNLSTRLLADRMLEACEILKLDVRSGTLFVRFSSLSLEAFEGFAHRAALECLRNIAFSVSRQDEIALDSLIKAASNVFPELRLPPAPGATASDEAFSFTAGSVLFQRLSLDKRLDIQLPQLVTAYDDRLDPKRVWVLHSQPFPKYQIPKAIIISPMDPNQASKLALRTSINSQTRASRDLGWSAWQLWDGRYWIRVRNLTSRALVVRPCKEGDMKSIHGRINPLKLGRFRRALKDAAPGKIRWALPVIAENDESQNENINASIDEVSQSSLRRSQSDRDQMGKVLVFPTLGTSGWLDIFDKEGRRKLEWEVRYKEVSLRRRDGSGQIFGHNPKTVIAWDNGGQGRSTAKPLRWRD